MGHLQEFKQSMQMERLKKTEPKSLDEKPFQKMWPLTSAINKVGLCLRGRRREQLVIVLVGAEGARMVPLAGLHHSVGHHDVAQGVIQVAVQKAALVFGRRHVVLAQRRGLSGRA